MQQARYDYTQAGFNPFLTRSIDVNVQPTLGVDSVVQSRSVAFDRGQVNGFFGDILQIGRVRINKDGYISFFNSDGEEVGRVGDLEA